MSALACLLASSCAGSDLIGFMCGNVFQSHTCEIPPHLLAISSGHNTQQREESPQRLDSLDCSSAFIAAEEKRLAAAVQHSKCCLISFCLFPLLFSIPFDFPLGHSGLHSLSLCAASYSLQATSRPNFFTLATISVFSLQVQPYLLCWIVLFLSSSFFQSQLSASLSSPLSPSTGLLFHLQLTPASPVYVLLCPVPRL